MDVIYSLKSSIKLLGIKEENGEVSGRFYMFSLIYLIVITNMITFLVEKWKDIDDRINALKAIVFLTTFIGYMILTINNWDEFSSMINVLQDMNSKIPYPVSSERTKLINFLKINMRKFNRFWLTMLAAYSVAMTMIPALIVFIKVWFLSGDFQMVIKETLSTPFPLYFPHYKTELNTLIYVMGYCLQLFYAVYTCLSGHVANVTPLSAMTHVEFELKSLRLSLMEMEEFLVQGSPKRGNEYETKLKGFLRYFIRHHQNTCRKFNLVNRGIRWTAATVSTTASLYICMSIYIIVQKDEIIFKVQEATLLGVWAYAVYLLDSCGERIKTEGENLRNALYECPWTHKPHWFKSSILIAMTRTSKTLDVNPLGLFALNLSSFAVTMNAAYSYYNLLYKFKNT